MDYLNISDTQVAIGEERLVVDNPAPDIVAGTVLSFADNNWSLSLLMRLNVLEAQVLDLQAEIIQLQSRTFWSLFKDWLHSFWPGK